MSGTGFTITDQFFIAVPVSLDAGTISGDIELFDVTAGNPFLDLAGTYQGTYMLIGGVDGGAQDYVAPANFNVTTAVPEPSAAYLLLGGICVALVIRAKAGRS